MKKIVSLFMANTPYYFALDIVNNTGITKGKTILKPDSSY